MKNAYIIVISWLLYSAFYWTTVGKEREMEMGFWNFDKVWNAKLLFFEGMIKLNGVVNYLMFKLEITHEKRINYCDFMTFVFCILLNHSWERERNRNGFLKLW